MSSNRIHLPLLTMTHLSGIISPYKFMTPSCILFSGKQVPLKETDFGENLSNFYNKMIHENHKKIQTRSIKKVLLQYKEI